MDKTKALQTHAVTEINTGNEHPLEEIAFLTPMVGHETQNTSINKSIAEYLFVFGFLTLACVPFLMELYDGTMLVPYEE